MNLTPEWLPFLSKEGFEAQHWSSIGLHNAPDEEIMSFAREHRYVVFTHDLDFGHLLAVTNAAGPSVVQVRAQDPTPGAVGEIVIASLEASRAQLERGALVTIEPSSMRLRILPLFPPAQ